MLCRLKHALLTDNVNLKYQPVYSTFSQKIVGFEALLRWHDPHLGRICPEKLVKLASSNGLMDTVSVYVIKKAMAQMADVMKHYHLFLSLNVDPGDLIADSFKKILLLELVRYQLAPSSVLLEITEVPCHQPESLASNAMLLAQRGFKIALDDFGKGCSGFDRLLALPVSDVKIDRALTHALCTRDARQQQALGMCSRLYQLPYRLIFEGVETEQQYAFLQTHFPHALMQGWYFSKPVSIEDVHRLMFRQICMES